ncbi:RIX1 domain containing protein [Pyrenophora teres f. maculata]|nr:RIX1 domain containing protein [Pyrenophora teres f. maculata]
MAPIISELATLRALSFRISSTPTSQLPQHVPAIASALANCRTLLSSPQASGTKPTSSEASVAIHKFRTLLSTLLQDRTCQGRWCAIVLIKATIEVGGWETLQKSLPWVRGLLSFLNKPDPPSSKKLCIITLTRIFFLTREYPTLVREITTPSLPTFIQSTLHMANATSTPAALLQTTLECLSELLPRHPTIFRSYLKQLHSLLAHLIAPTPSNKISQEQIAGAMHPTSSEITMAARELYIQLSCCAPKGASSEEWMKSLKNLVNNAHQTADRVFRAVVEDWQPTIREAHLVTGHTLEDEVQDLEPNNHLPPWTGIFAGGERLKGLLNLIREYLGTPTAGPIYLNIAMIMDLVSRVLSLTIPASSSKNFQNTVRLNIQVSKDEREALWLLLPDLHIEAMKLLLALADRSQASTLALDPIVIDQVVWVFGAEKNVAHIRTTCYTVVASLLKRSGTTLPKSAIDSLVPVIRSCCDDLLPSETATTVAQQNTTQTKSNGNSQPQTTANADSFMSASKSISDPIAGFSGLKEAAYDLLPILLSKIRAQYLSDSMRARLDRTAVLAQHKEAMLASALNPPPSKKFGKPAASVLPLLVRSYPAEMDIEGMLRPRMPVIRLGGQEIEIDQAEEEDVESEEEIEEEGHSIEHAYEHFVGQELDDLLENAGQTETVVRDFAMTDALAASPAANAPSPSLPESSMSQRPMISEPTVCADVKRPMGDEGPLSPSKRAKTGEAEQGTTQPISPVLAHNASIDNYPITSGISATSDFTATSTASAAPELPVPGENGLNDDSDDDKISLVLGQDTDDESD